MAKRTYPALLEPADGGYGISFPDLPGCVSFADTLAQAPLQAAEALSLHLEGMAEDGEAFPGHDEQTFAAAYAEVAPTAGWMAVTVEAPDEAERVNIYLQKSLLERIDAHAAESGVNRSSWFVSAAKAHLDAAGKLQKERVQVHPAGVSTGSYEAAVAAIRTSEEAAARVRAAIEAMTAMLGEHADRLTVVKATPNAGKVTESKSSPRRKLKL